MEFEFDGARFDTRRCAMDDYPLHSHQAAWRAYAPVRSIPVSRTVRLARRFAASADRLFAAWLDPRVAGRWLFATASQPLASVFIDARVRGEFRLVDERDGRAERYSGRYLEIVPARRLAFTLSMPCTASALTRVTVDIERVGSRSRLRLVQDYVPSARANYVRDRWSGVLYGLGVTLAVGDLDATPHRQST